MDRSLSGVARRRKCSKDNSGGSVAVSPYGRDPNEANYKVSSLMPIDVEADPFPIFVEADLLPIGNEADPLLIDVETDLLLIDVETDPLPIDVEADPLLREDMVFSPISIRRGTVKYDTFQCTYEDHAWLVKMFGSSHCYDSAVADQMHGHEDLADKKAPAGGYIKKLADV